MPDLAADTPSLKPGFSWPLVAVCGVAGALIAATLVLWMHYGTAVFFEIIAAGLAACF